MLLTQHTIKQSNKQKSKKKNFSASKNFFSKIKQPFIFYFQNIFFSNFLLEKQTKNFFSPRKKTSFFVFFHPFPPGKATSQHRAPFLVLFYKKPTDSGRAKSENGFSDFAALGFHCLSIRQEAPRQNPRGKTSFSLSPLPAAFRIFALTKNIDPMRATLGKNQRLKSSKQIREIFSGRKSVAAPPLRILWSEIPGEGDPLAAFFVPKKYYRKK